MNTKFVAILSTTVLPVDGTYCVTTLQGEARQEALSNLAGIPHFTGHPDTKKLIEALGAVPASAKLFSGQKVGETVLCVPLLSKAYLVELPKGSQCIKPSKSSAP